MQLSIRYVGRRILNTGLGIHKSDGTYIGAPRGHTEIHPGDTLVLYGRSSGIGELDARRMGVSGDRAHAEAVKAQKGILR